MGAAGPLRAARGGGRPARAAAVKLTDRWGPLPQGYGALQFLLVPFSEVEVPDPAERRRFLVGHCNPLISLAAWLTGEITLMNAVMYATSQFFGASLASVFLVIAVPDARSTQLGTTVPVSGTTELHAVLAELVCTFVFVLVTLNVMIGRSEEEEEVDAPADGGDPRAESLFVKEFAPLIVAFTLFACTCVGGAISGGSFNVARSWGPALVSTTWTSHWLYWVGPLFGTLFAATLFNVTQAMRRDGWLSKRSAAFLGHKAKRAVHAGVPLEEEEKTG